MTDRHFEIRGGAGPDVVAAVKPLWAALAHTLREEAAFLK